MRLPIPEGIGWTTLGSPFIEVVSSRTTEKNDDVTIVNTFLGMFTNLLFVWKDMLVELYNVRDGKPYDTMGYWNDWGRIKYGIVECVVDDYGQQKTTIYLEDLITILEQALEYLETHPLESL